MQATRPRPLSVPTCSENNMAKSKDKKKDTENGERDENKDDTKNEEPALDYDELVKRVCAIAKPLAGRKLTKRLYKTVKKGKRLDTIGEQGWRSGESARLPPMCPGFDSRTRRHMWAEFVGSLLCSERFFSGNSGFPLSTKTNI